MGYIEQLERRIEQKINAVKAGKLSPSESKIGILFKALKEKDEVSYEVLIAKYKNALK